MKSEKLTSKVLGVAAAITAAHADLPPASAQDKMDRPESRMAREARDLQEQRGGYVSTLPEGAREFTREQIQSMVSAKGAYLDDLVRKLMADQNGMQDYEASKESLLAPDKKVVYIEYNDAKGKFYYRQAIIGRFQADIILHETSDKRFVNNALTNIRAIYIAPDRWMRRSK